MILLHFDAVDFPFVEIGVVSTRLPYFDDLLLPHNIDVMHTEKNVAEALWATLMDTKKSKDNPKATLCDRPNQEMQPPSRGKT